MRIRLTIDDDLALALKASAHNDGATFETAANSAGCKFLRQVQWLPHGLPGSAGLGKPLLGPLNELPHHFRGLGARQGESASEKIAGNARNA